MTPTRLQDLRIGSTVTLTGHIEALTVNNQDGNRYPRGYVYVGMLVNLNEQP